ncbi:apolipoprotein N-acyltransferase [Alphaproteobacteria bacterium LSUCC0684]
MAWPPKADRSPGWGLLWATLSGILASASLPPLNFTFAIFALSLPALAMVMARRGREAFFIGWATGFGWFLLSLSWVSVAFVTSGGGHVFLIPFAALGLPLLLGVFWGAGFFLAWRIKQDQPARLLALIATLSLMEYMRGTVLSGFPWNAPGMVLLVDERILGIVAFTGLWGATLLAFLFALIPALIWCRRRWTAGLAAAILLGFLGLGIMHHETPASETNASGMVARLVQPNVPQDEKWLKDRRPEHLGRLAMLSQQAASTTPDVIIWPESAFAGIIEREGDVFQRAIAASSAGVTPIITGALSFMAGDQVTLFNSTMLTTPGGNVLARYDKTHLVPFGEYAPGRGYLPFVEVIAGPVDFSSGKGPVGFDLAREDRQGKVILTPLICYEIIFPALVRQAVKATGADILVTITNDAWFGDTIGPRQHLAMAQLRAAELGMPVLRVANTGISAGIDSHGRIADRIEFGQAGFSDVVVSGSLDTFYRRHGDLCWWLMLAGMGLWAMASSILTLRK